VISGNEDKEIKFFDLRANEKVSGFIGHTDAVSAVQITSNGLQLLSGGHDGSVRYWDI
jgi:striatin 1/3/4